MAKSNKSLEREETLIFIHIPKAAGTTLVRIIQRQYEKDVIYSVASGRHDSEPIDEFKALPDAQKEKIRVLRGHIPFGLHDYLRQPSVYMTMLRDPVDRVISIYYYILRKRTHHLHTVVKNMSLKDFVCSGMISDIENGQTRFLSGTREIGTAVPSGHLASEHLEAAKRNLQERFVVAGISERFDETLMLCQRYLEWGSVFYTRRNVTSNRPCKENIPQDTMVAIEKLNGLDIELYRYAKDRLESLIRKQGISFEREVNMFRLQNKLYNRVQPVFRILRKGRHLLR